MKISGLFINFALGCVNVPFADVGTIRAVPRQCAGKCWQVGAGAQFVHDVAIGGGITARKEGCAMRAAHGIDRGGVDKVDAFISQAVDIGGVGAVVTHIATGLRAELIGEDVEQVGHRSRAFVFCPHCVKEAHVDPRQVNYGFHGFAAVFAVETYRTFKVQSVQCFYDCRPIAKSPVPVALSPPWAFPVQCVPEVVGESGL